MNLTEIKSEFQILFEDLATSGSKGLDDYEISVMLTMAQEFMVKEFAGQGLETPIQELIKVREADLADDGLQPVGLEYSKYPTALLYKGSSAMVTLQRTLIENVPDTNIGNPVGDSKQSFVPVAIVTSQVIDRMLMGAYKYPPKNLAYVVVGVAREIVYPPLKLLTAIATGNNENVNTTGAIYYRREVDYPSPIILADGLAPINGIAVETDPVLPEYIHRDIIKTAVDLAVDFYIGQPEKAIDNGSSGNK